MVRNLAALAYALMLAGCGGSVGSDTSEDLRSGSLSVQGYYSGVEDRRTLVLRDTAALQRLWAEHTRFVTPAPPPPEVDFIQNDVVAFFGGTYPSGGYEARIDRVIERGGIGIVYVTLLKPSPDSGVTGALSQPHAILGTKKLPPEVKFEVTERVR